MKKKYQNIFFIFGLVVLLLMITQLNFSEVWKGLIHAGYWFFAVVALWFFIYMLNTGAWMIIIRSQKPEGKVRFWWLYKITVSGFALNYTTPAGLMGGEPYRIMALSPKIGIEKASASVILYAMTHIYSHFWFWGIASLLFLATQPFNVFLTIVMLAIFFFSVFTLWLFMKGYKKGMTVACIRLLKHLPFIKKWAGKFLEKRSKQLADIDRQITALHNQNPRLYAAAVILELICRFTTALEVMFCLLVLVPGGGIPLEQINGALYLNCLFIIAFTSLFANLLFFLPLQLGGREGGFVMSTAVLHLTANAGIFIALIIRLRELIWTVIGLLLIKLFPESPISKTK